MFILAVTARTLLGRSSRRSVTSLPVKMAAAGESEADEENILYDLLINTEWPPETDTQLRGLKEQSPSVLAKAVTGPFRFILHYLWYSPSSATLPAGLVRLTSKQTNWHVVLGSNGKLLAVVQDQCVEIRSARDDFGSVIGKCQVPKDPHPQWRRVAWSADCALLAYSESTGTVRVFDLMGSELFIIPPAVSFPGDFSYAAAALMFLEYTASAQWSAELLVITYSGQLRSYLVSVGTNQSFQENHSYCFSTHITSALYHPAHRLLLVGGCECGDHHQRLGITAWRVLSGSPHYKQLTGCEDDTSASPRRGFLKMPSFRLFSRHDHEKDGVFRMSLSPDGTVLAAIHFSGALSLWDVPSMRLRGRWRQEEQPGYDEINPEWKTSLEKRKKIKDKEQYQCLLEVSWWSESAVILARCSGALTVSSVHTLNNLLGTSCEWFQPSPRLTPAHEGGFLSLECEVKLAHKRSRVESSVTTEGEHGEDDSDSEDEASAKTRYFSYVKRGLYYVTEMERFAPLRKRPRSVIKSYRLVSLRSTTPEELYQRKIDSEEYGEALSLAQAYGLDSDLVYQRQWRKSTVSIASIQDYLSKIKKRSWVLHECVERVPENVDAAKELLQYGLKGTDLEALISIGDGGDRGRFILPGDVDVDDAPYEDFLSAEEEVEQRKAREAERRRQLLKKVEFSRLNLEQKELCRNRLKLLCYLDRLATYEEILGGPHAAEMRFDGDFFKKFRNQNLLLSARTYARESNVQALDILFSYHGSELLPHRLALLCNFPETTSPHEYTDLLPKARPDKKGHLGLVPWEETRHRDLDWCEAPDCRASVQPNPEDDCTFLYEEQPELKRFCSAKPSIALLTDWYLSRAQDIESNSRQVDCSLSLVRLGREQNIPGLELLCDDLVTMETLVYEASCDLSLTLKELQQLKDIDKLRLLMKNSGEETYVRNSFQWMVPFLQRCESRRSRSAFSLIREYLLTLAREDLTLPLTLFQHSKPHCHPKIIGDADQLMRVALACVYECERDDQLALCYDLLECLPQRGYGLETDATEALHDQVDRLEKHLSVAEVLEKHGLQKPIMFVRSCENSVEEAHQLMVRLTRHTGRKNPPVSESVWRDLLQDLLDMQKNVYTCLEPESCHQVFVESLLCSGREENVRLAGQLMHRSALSEDTPISAPFRVSYRRSVELVQAAAREYFDSSATLSDPCMDLARSCLLLITDCPPLIQEELDLISALSLLEQLGVKVLPLQVRLRADRLSLIKECVSMSPTAYRQPSLLLGVAALLRVSGDDEAERKGRVLTLLAEQALHAQDFTASYAHCEELMSAGYSEGWCVCASLGVCEVLSPLAARQRLLAFSLTHCPASFIQDLLVSSSSLQTQVLYQAVNYQIDPAAASQTGNGAPASINPTDLLHRTTARTIQVLTSTTSSTRAALYSLGDAHWWKESLSLLRPLHGAARTRVSSANHSAALEQQGCGPFYQDLFCDPLISPTQEVYSSYDYTPGEQVAEVLLRTVSLTQTSSEGRSPCPVTEVLLELACDAVVSDVALALAYLLALPRACEADRCFQKQPPSALWLQFAVYYYCLQIYSRLTPCVTDQCSPVYRADPRELIGLVTKHVSDHAGADWADEELKTLIGRLRLYSERLTDFTQAQVLQGLGRGVDVQRFSNDPQYKKETILGLAETLDEKVYGISRSLAQRYSIPLWDVHMTHLEFLFTDSGLSVRDVESRCDALGLMATLRSDPEAFHAHMTRYVWPSLEGEDQPVLLLYFTLLESCGCGLFFPPDAVKLDTHLKLLKKLRAVAAGLDYKKLMGGACDPLEALEPVLTSQNVLSVSKLAALIPRPEGDALTPSAVHATWLRKLFWTGDAHVMKKRPHTDQDFLLAYDACARHLHRLLPADLLRFLNAVTFTPEAASRLSVEARLEISRRAQVALKGLREKSRKRAGEEKSDLYDLSLSHVEQSIAHLETLSQHFPVSLLTSPEERLRAYGRAYDLSRSEPSELRRLGVTMAMEGVAVVRVRQLLAVAVCSRELTAQSVMRDAVQRILAALSGDTPALEHSAEPLKLLEGLVSAVQEDVLSGGDTVTSEDLLAWLRPFCGDDSKPVCLRMDVLQLLEQRFRLVEPDLQMLLLYRSQALLKTCWPHRECEMIHVQGEQERYTLFLELLESSRKWEEFQHLMMLLQAWPPIRDQTRLQADQNPWVGVASAVLAHCSGSAHIDPGAEVLAMCRSLYPTPHKLQPQCVERVSRALLDAGLRLCALKLLMESEEESLHTLALDHISSITQVTSEVCDAELMSALLDAGLLLECVDTPLYAPLSAHMLALGRWDTEGAVRALQGAGRGVQAGSLLLSARGTHPAHVTFSTALAAIRKWI